MIRFALQKDCYRSWIMGVSLAEEAANVCSNPGENDDSTTVAVRMKETESRDF